ncbi:MAG: hypothetical protein HRU32_17600, partial [Rhodobacteraceae bacterium]|nr:hypothetical protein [Paracoccaceae bacterium]
MDGVLEFSADLEDAFESPIASGGYLAFGQDQDGSQVGGGFSPLQAYVGGFAEINIFDNVLSSTDIDARSNNGGNPPADPAGLVHSWSVDGANQEIITNAGEALGPVNGLTWVDGTKLAPKTIDEGDDLSLLTLIVTDGDGNLADPNLFFEVSITSQIGATLQTTGGQVTSFLANNFADLQTKLAETTIALPDPDLYGDVSIELAAVNGATSERWRLTQEMTIEPVDDLEFFINTPSEDLVVLENTKNPLFPDDDPEAGPPQERGVVPVASKSEEEIYAALDLPWIAPELREGRGETKDDHPRPVLIEVADVRAELHAHTTASDGVHATPRGFHTIAVTDHSQAAAIANGLSPERLEAHIDAVRAANDRVEGIRILAGSEVDILKDGDLDYEDELLEKLDIVVASPHTTLD